jgi:hypothetical protein
MRAARDGESADIAIMSDIGFFGVTAQDFYASLKAKSAPRYPVRAFGRMALSAMASHDAAVVV